LLIWTPEESNRLIIFTLAGVIIGVVIGVMLVKFAEISDDVIGYIEYPGELMMRNWLANKNIPEYNLYCSSILINSFKNRKPAIKSAQVRRRAIDYHLVDFWIGQHGSKNFWKARNSRNDLLSLDNNVCDDSRNDPRQYQQTWNTCTKTALQREFNNKLRFLRAKPCFYG